MNTTNDKIIEGIKKYIDDNFYDYAVMIDGEWGCGKTYFVKNELMKEVEDHVKDKDDENPVKKIIYLSLYGMKSIDDISKQMVYEAYLNNLDGAKSIAKAGIKISKILLPTAFDIINNKFGINIDKEKISETICNFASLKNTLLIFDDLERCDCPINEVLGYINSFVEQDHLKVIIVANQKELGKNFYNNNLELKYLVAADPRIVIKTMTKSEKILNNYFHSQEEKTSSKNEFNIREIVDRANELFSKDLVYEKIKEKLIGKIFYFEPNLKEVIDEIIKNSDIDSSLKNHLENHCSDFVDVMKENDCINIRTFQFFLSKISDLYKIIIQNVHMINNSNEIENFIENVINYCFQACIFFRKDNLEYNWRFMEEYGYKIRENNTILSFKFVDDYIIKNLVDTDAINKVYTKYYKEYDLQINFLWKKILECKEKTESDNICDINEIKSLLENKKFAFDVYETIVSYFINLEEIGFNEDYLDEIIEIMKKNIQENDENDKINFYSTQIIDDEKKRTRYNQVMNQLKAEVDKLNNKSYYDKLGGILDEPNWSKELYLYVYNNCKKIIEKDVFLSIIDIEHFSQKLASASPKDISMVRTIINAIYSNGKLNKEYPLLIELKNKILETGNEGYDIVKNFQINGLVNDIEKITEFKETNETT